MKTQFFVCCFLAITLSISIADEAEDETTQDDATQILELTQEQLKRFAELMGREKRGFVIPPRDSGLLEDSTRYSGKWIEQDGVKKCDGYLTRFEDDEYCSAEIPKDWEPFEFEGKTYYIQPLSVNGS